MGTPFEELPDPGEGCYRLASILVGIIVLIGLLASAYVTNLYLRVLIILIGIPLGGLLILVWARMRTKL